MSNQEWWKDPSNVATLLRHMRDSGAFDMPLAEAISRVLEIVDRPWRWTPEWEAMLSPPPSHTCADCGHAHDGQHCECGCRVGQVCL